MTWNILHVSEEQARKIQSVACCHDMISIEIDGGFFNFFGSEMDRGVRGVLLMQAGDPDWECVLMYAPELPIDLILEGKKP